MTERIVFASKSTWIPNIRREHALTHEAIRHGHEMMFVESPRDIRDIPSQPKNWIHELTGTASNSEPGVTVWKRSTFVPGHKHPKAATFDSALLRRVLQSAGSTDAIVVGMLPWQWPAIRKSGGKRLIFDAADDWTALIPQRATEISKCYERIADEADEIIVVSPLLAELFPNRQTICVRNGAPAETIANNATTPPGDKRMIYVGTLSERFDAPFMEKVLELLPDWTLDLYGQSRYSNAADSELQHLLNNYNERAVWHGVVNRTELSGVLDDGDVLVVPNRASYSSGQSSMKLFDYAARGRPIVTSDLEVSHDQTPPHTSASDDPAAFARLVEAAADEPPAFADDRLSWARDNTWAKRWSQWMSAAFG